MRIAAVSKARPSHTVSKVLANYGIALVLVLLCVLFCITIGPTFYSMENVFNILKQVAVVGIMSVGMTMVIISAGIDLSVGATVGVACVLTAQLLLTGLPVIPAIAIVLVLSAAIGFVNALLINVVKIPPFIATLGMMTALRGVAYIITGGLPVFGFTSDLLVLGQGYVWKVPVPVIIMAIVFLIGIVFLERTRLGRYIYGVGGNEEATRLSGIDPSKVRYFVYSVCGLLAGLAGIVMLARINSGTPKMGTGYEMDVITAVILGGVSIAGGEGRLGFVVVGVLIMGVLTNGLILLNVEEYVQWVIKGLALLAAVGLDRLIKVRESS